MNAMGTNIISFVVVLGVLIFFHELGHFLVARLFGVGVEKFSLGFGPRLLGKKSGINKNPDVEKICKNVARP